MPFSGSLVTAVILIVVGLVLVSGLLTWAIKFTGFLLIAWGIVAAIVAVSRGGRGQRH